MDGIGWMMVRFVAFILFADIGEMVTKEGIKSEKHAIIAIPTYAKYIDPAITPLPIPTKTLSYRPHTISPSGKPRDLNGIGRGGGGIWE